MRIYGNRLLKTLPGPLTRPTTARVREALFNIWQGKIQHCRWLDLCAGNGSLGAEALCRGASLAIAIDKSSRACTIIKQNWQQIATDEQQFKVIPGDVITQIKTLTVKFDRVYFDPPYNSQLYQPVLAAIANYQLLDQDGEIAVEHDPKQWQAITVPNLEVCREKQYGNTALTFYRVKI
jgi:16S rRNA (guanine(966)-N(2))-methyltransferase RsmD